MVSGPQCVQAGTLSASARMASCWGGGPCVLPGRVAAAGVDGHGVAAAEAAVDEPLGRRGSPCFTDPALSLAALFVRDPPVDLCQACRRLLHEHSPGEMQQLKAGRRIFVHVLRLRLLA